MPVLLPKTPQVLVIEGLFAEHTGVGLWQCVMGCKASYIPLSLCFPPCHPQMFNSFFFSLTSLPAATFSYSAQRVHSAPLTTAIFSINVSRWPCNKTLKMNKYQCESESHTWTQTHLHAVSVWMLPFPLLLNLLFHSYFAWVVLSGSLCAENTSLTHQDNVTFDVSNCPYETA